PSVDPITLACPVAKLAVLNPFCYAPAAEIDGFREYSGLPSNWELVAPTISDDFKHPPRDCFTFFIDQIMSGFLFPIQHEMFSLSNLYDGTRTVDEYEREFTRLAAVVPDLVRTEAQRAQRFIDGLYPAVRHNIVGHGTQTYARAVSIAQEVDASIRREAIRDHSQPSAPAQSSSVPPMPALPAAQPPKNNKRKGKGAPMDKRTRRRLQQIP
ncbi:Unknown protein, partial [Striga hermonthica]